MTANPDVKIQFGPERYSARAVVTQGEERAQLWNKIVNAMPRFADYQTKTKRLIPVIRLERA